ncbi:hypothetical protein EON67_07555 [archaeon]|nr:MAG: hypothetical protein EON67_07555 [archaeon]
MLSADGHYTKSVDIWSAGCVLAELLGRTPLFAGVCVCVCTSLCVQVCVRARVRIAAHTLAPVCAARRTLQGKTSWRRWPCR